VLYRWAAWRRRGVDDRARRRISSCFECDARSEHNRQGAIHGSGGLPVSDAGASPTAAQIVVIDFAAGVADLIEQASKEVLALHARPSASPGGIGVDSPVGFRAHAHRT
jgi:hypothetical protein